MRFASDEWFAAWTELTNSDPDFRAAGVGWQGSVGLVVRADASHPVVHVRLEGAEGQWTSVTVSADAVIVEGTTFALTADRATWQAVVAQELDPIRALITGRVRVRGQLSAILSRLTATRIMTRRLAEVPTEFDNGGEAGTDEETDAGTDGTAR